MNKPISQLVVIAALFMGAMAATALTYDAQMQGEMQSYGGAEKIMRAASSGVAGHTGGEAPGGGGAPS